MQNSNNKLSEVLDLVPIDDNTKVAEISNSEQTEEKYDEADYRKVKENIESVIELGNQALEELNDLAASSQSPIAYTALATLMKTVTSANKQLLEIKKINAELKSKSQNSDKPAQAENSKIINNQLFVGSTAELLEAMQNKKNQDKD